MQCVEGFVNIFVHLLKNDTYVTELTLTKILYC